MNMLLFGMVLAACDHIGVWKIESAKAAPWTVGPPQPPPPLVGKRITFGPKAIAGPQPLACASARYRVVETPAEGLFQGNFDEMKRRNPSGPSPAQIAAEAGLKTASGTWRTLQTGCDFDFHYVNDHTAAFALDNYLYIISKQ